MRTARLGVAAAAAVGGTVATMNAVTEESLDWNAAAASATGERRAKTVRNSLSAGPSFPPNRPDLVQEAGNRPPSGPTAGGVEAVVSESFHRPGWFEFPDPFPTPVPQGKRMSSEAIKHISDASFETDVLKSGTPVLVDYWAEWCGPCKAIAPILEEVARDYGARIQIAKMNVDENRDVPAKFGIRGIPTLMLFKDGQLAATKVGALSKSQLTSFLEGHLGSAATAQG
jgi:thioredoxin 1